MKVMGLKGKSDSFQFVSVAHILTTGNRSKVSKPFFFIPIFVPVFERGGAGVGGGGETEREREKYTIIFFMIKHYYSSFFKHK